VNRNAAKLRRMNVRTTAYCVHERGGGGRRNAIGDYLSCRVVRSAASDWSRFPLGTRFKIVETDEEYVIDDYGTALVGTNTIDLYKPTRLEMKRWGVRHVDIDILQWGSDEQSIKVLAPRAKHRTPRRILLALVNKKKSSQLADQSL
jgi:3D (Asp-Asp-Asp) domain-containing protein